jgi:rubrerythrin
MLSTLAARVARIRGRTATESIRDAVLGTDETDTSSTQPDARLFRCSACDVVYVDTEKQVCPTCDQPVEAVPATLTR